MLITNLLAHALSPSTSDSDFRVLDLLANPRRCCDRSRVPESLRYFREEHSELMVHFPNGYTRRYWWWIFWRASI